MSASCPMVYHADIEGHFDWEPGHFGFGPEQIEGRRLCYMVLPNGSLCILPVIAHRKENQAWEWDGNIERPTFRPSILHHSTPEWHGFVTDGQMVGA